jgi:hypothetical protein
MAAKKHRNEDIAAALPRVEPEPGEYRQLVLKSKDAIVDRTPGALVTAYEAARLEREAIEARHSEEIRPVYARIQALEELLPVSLRDAGIDSVVTAGHYRVGYKPDVLTKTIDNDALIAWAKANGYERKLTLYAATINSITKERLRDGAAIPDGVDARGVDKVTFVKA